jgi:hypothetical protein
MAKTNRERVETYRAKQRAAGIVEVLVRVPSSMRERVLDLAVKLRAGAPWPQDPPSVRVVRVEVPGPVRVERVKVPGPVRVDRIEVPGPVKVDWVILASAVLPALTLGVLVGVVLQKYYHG